MTKYPCPLGFPAHDWEQKTEGERAAWYASTGYIPPAPPPLEIVKTDLKEKNDGDKCTVSRK